MPPVPESLRKKTSVKSAGAPTSAPPTSEIGGVLNGVFSIPGMMPWVQFVDDDEYVPELRWPASIRVYDKMATDSQLKALYDGTRLPLMHFNWLIDPNDCPNDAIVHRLARDLNLPIQGETNQKQPKLRQRKRFSFAQHLRKALYAGKYGHYFFEQVGYIADDGLWSLAKLAERPPKTIQQIAVASDGGLIFVRQNVTVMNSLSQGLSTGMLPEIPVDRLVAYVWEQEGGDWVGKSWFRECYRNWLIKDRLMRIDAVNHEKAGGVPIGVAPPGSTPTEVRQVGEVARNFNVGMDSGAGLPAGSDIHIVRAAGSDVVASMRYHDEAMARRFLLMLLQLGQTTTGSRALGTTFVDFFGQGLNAIAQWVVDIFCDHVIEDYVDWNWGTDIDPVPRLVYEFDPELAVTDLVELIAAGAIIVDDDLENELRRELGIPKRTTPRPSPEQLQDPGYKPGITPGSTNPKTSYQSGENTPAKAERGDGREGLEGAPSPESDRPHRRKAAGILFSTFKLFSGFRIGGGM